MNAFGLYYECCVMKSLYRFSSNTRIPIFNSSCLHSTHICLVNTLRMAHARCLNCISSLIIDWMMFQMTKNPPVRLLLFPLASFVPYTLPLFMRPKSSYANWRAVVYIHLYRVKAACHLLFNASLSPLVRWHVNRITRKLYLSYP